MNRRGLTALELVVALAITGLAAGIGSATLGLLTDQRDRFRVAATPIEHAATVRRTLVGWLEGAHGSMSPSPDQSSPSFQLLDIGRRGHSADELLFATSGPTPLGTGEALVRLFVADDDRSAPRGLLAEITAYPGAPSVRVQLDSTVGELDVRCLTDLLGSRRWVATWLSSTLLPRGVELRLRPRRGAQLDPLLQLPVVVALEGGR